MPYGPGKYDGFVSDVIEQTDAVGVVLVVLGGNKGSGFSVQGPAEVTAALPRILREMADEIERDIK